MYIIFIGNPPHIVSPFEGLQKYFPDAKSSKGCDIEGTDESNIAEAATLASQTDAVVMFIGISQEQEAEGLDRT